MEEISLRECIEVLIKRWKIVIGITAFAILVSGIVSFFVLETVYETKMLLMANINNQIQLNTLENDTNIDQILDSLYKYPLMTLETYLQQIKAPKVMEKTIQDLGIEEEYDIDKLSSVITLEAAEDTNLITIKMKHKNSDQAAKIVNQIGENFVDFVSTSTQENFSKYIKYTESQMIVVKQNLEESFEELRTFLYKSRGLSELSLELDAKLSQITDYKIKQTDMTIRREAVRAGISVANSQPEARNQIVIRENVANDISSFGNLVYENTETILRIELAEIESIIRQLEGLITQIQGEIGGLQVELLDKTHEERLINQRVDMAQKNYDAFLNKFEELKLYESSQEGESPITIISKAYPTNKPVGPNKKLNLAIAAILGLMLGIFAVFFIEYWEKSNPAKQKESKN